MRFATALLFLLALLGAIFTSGVAHATTYTDYASWEAAIAATPDGEEFDFAGAYAHGDEIDAVDLSFTDFEVTSFTNLWFFDNLGAEGIKVVATEDIANPTAITFTFTEPVGAVMISIFDAEVDGYEMDFGLESVSGVTADEDWDYVGYVGTGITEVTVTSTATNQDDNFVIESLSWAIADADGDGYDSDVYGGDDCDDADATINPDAAETYYDGIDQNCDGLSDYDADEDGYDSDAEGGDDCDDDDATINPDAAETYYDGIDSNCDGLSDYDADEDGYDSDTYGGDDCDDADATINPGATETYDGVDNDCDGVIDNGTEGYDDDGDGYTEEDGDCDDADASVHPSATEICDEQDNDCDGTVDDGAVDALTWYLDGDEDGYGLDSEMTESCDQPDGYTELGGDCDDDDADFNPGASESCDDPTDYNCDGYSGATDNDGDGYYACEECDDGNAVTYPGATEICDEQDNDCDEQVDEDVTYNIYNYDADGDGFGDVDITTEACEDPGESWVEDATDCDDADATINPDAIESCNGVDDDCNGDVDDGLDFESWYADTDGDGFGSGDAIEFCEDPGEGWIEDATDCDDEDATINPDAREICEDGVDNDCSGDDAVCDFDDTGEYWDIKGGSGCTCSSTHSPVPVSIWWGVLMLAVRRRRRA